MRTCSITGIPFYHSQQAILIPVLIRKEYSDSHVSNGNVIPLPISVEVEIAEDVYIRDQHRANIMMSMISNIIGYDISWQAFECLRGKDKEVYFQEKEYVIDFFACHKNVYDSIIQDFKIKPHFSDREVGFDGFKESFKMFVEKNGYKNPLTETTSSFKSYLGAIRSNYAIPENFKEDQLDYFSEIQFINRFLSLIGKRWEASGIAAYEEDSVLALDIYKKSISYHN